MPSAVVPEISLREVTREDYPVLFDQMRDPESLRMAGSSQVDPNDRARFDIRWDNLLRNESIRMRAILWNGEVTGHVMAFVAKGKGEVGYWIGRRYWGNGIATRALRVFLTEIRERPLYARVAEHNTASIRVLEKCGFVVTEENVFAARSGESARERVMRLQSGNGGLPALGRRD